MEDSTPDEPRDATDTESSDAHRPEKRYDGIIWIGERPGLRVTIWAADAKEAGKRLRERYGDGHPYTLTNKQDAERLRQGPSSNQTSDRPA